MQNCSKPKKTFWQSLRIKGTKKILEFAYNLKEPKLKILEFLKTHAEYHPHPRDYDLIACPSKLEVKLDKVCFSDLFFTEDFSNLQQGLNKLLSDYPSNFGNQPKDLNEWFDNIYSYGSGGRLSFYISLSFKGKKNLKLIQSLQSADIHLKYISPSFIVLSIIVDPSDEFIKKFNQLIKTNPSRQNEIIGFNVKQRIPYLRTISELLVREAEFEELFLDINKSIVLLLRKYLGVGLSCFGSLPCLEILETNVSLKEIPKNQNLQQTPNKFKACCRFFDSFGYPFNLQPVYQKSNWWKFYPVHRNEVFYKKSQTYQILISSVDYEKSHNLSDQNFYQSASKTIYYTINDLLSFIFACNTTFL